MVCSCLMVWLQAGSLAEVQSSNREINTLRIGSQDLPPYGWKDVQGMKHGVIFDMNQEIGIRSGLPFTNEILPLSRMLMMLRNGEIDLLSSQAHRPALDSGDPLAVQFKINVVAVTRKGSEIRTIKDFKEKDLIYHHSASYLQLEGLPRKIYRVKSYRQAVQMLFARPNVDGAVFSEPAFYYWMRDLGLTRENFGRIIMVEPDKKQWIFVRRGMPPRTQEAIKKIVEEIYRGDLFENLLIKYGMK